MKGSAQAADLKNAIAAIAPPASDGADDYQIATNIGPGFLARARSGEPTLLIPLPVAPMTVGRRGGGFSLKPAERIAFEFAGRRWEQAAATLACTDSALIDTFLVLVVDVATRFNSITGAPTWSDLLAWVEEWQSLLGRRAVLTGERELGLWGELWVISNAADPDSLLAGWRGPDQEAVDFFFDGVGLEVKVSRRAHQHYVSQRQLDLPLGTHDAYLLSVWVGVEPIRGISLTGLVDGLLSRVADAPALLKRIAVLGYTPLDRDQYTTPFTPLEAPRWFRAEDVPRVRAIDPGISQLRYLVSLEIDKAVAPESTGALWRHFCQTEPSFGSIRIDES